MSAAPDRLPLFAAHAAFLRLAAKVLAQDKRLARLAKRIDELNRELAMTRKGIALPAGAPKVCADERRHPGA
jgi:hypothetical protein